MKNSRIVRVRDKSFMNLDNLRETINKEVGVLLPKTEILDDVLSSEKVKLMTKNYYKRKYGGVRL